MTASALFSRKNLARDFPAGVVTFLVALPLCLGIALASGAPLFSGILAGVIGGVVVGSLSGSPTSVSGPAAGLAAVVASQITALGSFEAFLLALFLAGALQILLGFYKAGFLAAFFPSSVVVGLLTAIGLLLILKQLPHVVGHDPDPIGDLAFSQPDHENTFTELWSSLYDVQLPALVLGALSIGVLLTWDRAPFLKKLGVPVPLVVVLLGVFGQTVLRSFGGPWVLQESHLVQVPVLSNFAELGALFAAPDVSAWRTPAVYMAALTIAAVASLETLLNLDATQAADPKRRPSPPDRELLAQGVGNMVCGLIGGLPVTSVVIRSTVNINAGNETKMSTIVHGALLALMVLLFPQILNMIPLASLAAILVMTGAKLASLEVFRRMWREGYAQFIPFLVTVVAIIGTDLLKGVGLGLAASIGFILHSSVRNPMAEVVERHVGGDVLRFSFGDQVTFLNRAALERSLGAIAPGSQVLLDASRCDYIDPDVLHQIHAFKDTTAPARQITVSLTGFKEHYVGLSNAQHFVDYATRELQDSLDPVKVLQLLQEGNERFRSGQRLPRNLARQVSETAQGQAPLAVVLSCIDSRTSSELVFDMGIGDVFSVRVAGNSIESNVLGSIEYSCSVAGARLIVIMGHTSCGALTAAVNAYGAKEESPDPQYRHIQGLLEKIHRSIDPAESVPAPSDSLARRAYVDHLAFRHVVQMMHELTQESSIIAALVLSGRVTIVGALYHVDSGSVEFFPSTEAATAVHG